MKTIAKRLVVLAFAVSSVGCSQGSSTSGVQDASVAPQATKTTGRTLALGHSANPRYIVRWPSRTISVNVKTSWSKKAAAMWVKKGFKFRMGRRGGIKFAGYEKRDGKLGWSRFTYRGGRIYKCSIWINPAYVHRFPIAVTMAHEMGHCLGMSGHIGNKLMNQYVGKKGHSISTDTVKFFNFLYSRKPGARI
jgi:hypothetical protein